MITTIQLYYDGVPHIVIRDAFGKLIADDDISDELYFKLTNYNN